MIPLLTLCVKEKSTVVSDFIIPDVTVTIGIGHLTPSLVAFIDKNRKNIVAIFPFSISFFPVIRTSFC